MWEKIKKILSSSMILSLCSDSGYYWILNMDKENIPTIERLKLHWKTFSEIYQEFDSAPQTFYFSLINALSLNEAHDILEIGCGRCILLPHSLQLKNQ